MVGVVAVQLYDPPDWVGTVMMFVLQLNTHTIGSVESAPFGVSVPITVTDEPLTDAEAVSEVETGLLSEPILRFRVIEPAPDTVTTVGSLAPKQDNPLEQVQLAKVYPDGT